MPRFRIFHLAAEKAESFREKAPRKPPYVLHRAHYEEGPVMSADSPYALWQELQQESETEPRTERRALDVGDALQLDDQLLLCNYWGFDPAEWRDASRGGDSSRATTEPSAPSDT